MKQFIYGIFIILLIFIAGCVNEKEKSINQNPKKEVTLKTDLQRYNVGDNITLLITNNLDHTIKFNLFEPLIILSLNTGDFVKLIGKTSATCNRGCYRKHDTTATCSPGPTEIIELIPNEMFKFDKSLEVFHFCANGNDIEDVSTKLGKGRYKFLMKYFWYNKTNLLNNGQVSSNEFSIG